MRHGWTPAVLVALLVAAAAPCTGTVRAAGERIVSFAADATVREDATLQVREEFLVRSEGSYFKWGLIRELPIGSEARWDKRFAGEWRKDTGIRVKILECTRRGAEGGDGVPALRDRARGEGSVGRPPRRGILLLDHAALSSPHPL
jgi:hypothetical protein